MIKFLALSVAAAICLCSFLAALAEGFSGNTTNMQLLFAVAMLFFMPTSLLIDDKCLDVVKRYKVADSNGTCVKTWTLASAMVWLPSCAQHAYIRDMFTYNIVASRFQGDWKMLPVIKKRKALCTVARGSK